MKDKEKSGSNLQSDLARDLAEVGRSFYRRGWVLGTSGNFSAVISSDPLLLVITQSGVDKGALSSDNFLEIDSNAQLAGGSGRPSDEARLHVAVVRARGAGAVLHTHSVWGTILSDEFAAERHVAIEGFEMLKGLTGVTTHEHRELLPIVENSQDMKALADHFEKALDEYTACHGILLRRHGLYTWGRDLTEAKRHVEILEFLLEVVGRKLLSKIEVAQIANLHAS